MPVNVLRATGPAVALPPGEPRKCGGGRLTEQQGAKMRTAAGVLRAANGGHKRLQAAKCRHERQEVAETSQDQGFE